VGPRAGLDRCGKSRPQLDSIPGPQRPQPVAVPTALPGPLRYPAHHATRPTTLPGPPRYPAHYARIRFYSLSSSISRISPTQASGLTDSLEI